MLGTTKAYTVSGRGAKRIAAGVMRSANCGMMRNRRSKLQTIALHTVGLGPERLPHMPYDIEGKTYYSIIEMSRLVGVPDETIIGWITGRLSLKGLSLDAVRDANSNQYFVSEDAVRVLQQCNTFVSADPIAS